MPLGDQARDFGRQSGLEIFALDEGIVRALGLNLGRYVDDIFLRYEKGGH